ncbi:MAG: ABC-2 transporter permease [Lachnospiraceae bacterium]|nr:ABC-2 transporter permease [Lachnospiraceae bacterium]
MKGLLIKDFKLIFGNVKMIVMLIFISIFLMFSQEEGAFTFVVSYMTIITSMFVLSTISYDDFDHGMSYLMTLPITRTVYAAEKYCFGLLCGAAGWLFSMVLCFIFGSLPGIEMINADFIVGCVLIYIVLICMLSIMIPVQLKFGGDNGKIVIFITIGVLVVIGVLVDKVAKGYGIDLGTYIEQIMVTAIDYIIPITIVGTILALGISFMISLRIMKNKQL